MRATRSLSAMPITGELTAAIVSWQAAEDQAVAKTFHLARTSAPIEFTPGQGLEIKGQGTSG